jgi:hypothetical protein
VRITICSAIYWKKNCCSPRYYGSIAICHEIAEQIVIRTDIAEQIAVCHDLAEQIVVRHDIKIAMLP